MPTGRRTKQDKPALYRNRQDASEEGWPTGTPYTVYFPAGDGFRGADLEHPAPLPRVGDSVDYIDERGTSRRFRVRDVIHTLQTSAAARPSVKEGDASPNALARTDDAPAEAPGGAGALRAGLPEVFLEAIERKGRGRRSTRR